MTVFLVSVGVSLLESAADYRKQTDRKVRDALRHYPPADLFRAITPATADTASQWLTGALSPVGEPAHSPTNAAALQARATCAESALWPSRMSAELDTFAGGAQAGHRLDRADTAILICSDTAPGLLAGVWNAVALAAGDVSRLRYIVDPRQVETSVAGTVTIARVPGLDVGDQAGFIEAMRWMGSLAKDLLDRPRPRREPLVCHLSGGYKAAIPYLIGLTEWIRSAGWGGPVDAFVQHETTLGQRIRLPLRQIPAETVRSELGAGWDEDGRRKSRPAGMLEGYAYDWNEVRREWELTPFGVGLRAVFGSQQPGL